MRSLVTLFFLLTIAVFSGSAQDSIPKKVHFYYGPRVGFNFSSFVGNEAHGSNLRAGALLGVYGNLKFSKHFSVQTEVVYLTAGSRYFADSLGSKQKEVKIDISYLTVPVLLDYVFKRDFHLQFGVQGALSLTSETVVTFNGISVKTASKENYRSFEGGIAGGFIYDTPLGINAGLRFYQSLSNLYYGENFQVYNTYFQVIIGYTFGKHETKDLDQVD